MKISNGKIEQISECSADPAEIKNSRFRADISECDFRGTSFSRTNLLGMSFEHSGMNEAGFKQVGLSDCVFEHCSMSGTAFLDVIFENAKITDSDFSGASISDCKLDGLTIDGFNVLELIEFYKNHKED